MSRILLTGATGYLGSRIAQMLLHEHHSLLCPVLSDAPYDYLTPMLKQVDITDSNGPGLTDSIFNFSPEIIVHTAARYERGTISLTELTDANLLFPLRILDAVLNTKSKVFWLNTDTSLDRSLNGYALSKHQFSEWGQYYANKGLLDFCNVLLEQFYGSGDSGSKLFPYLYDKMSKNEPIELTDGLQRRDMIYVDDVLNAYSILCQKRPTGYCEFPLGTGEAPQVKEVITYFAELLNTKSELQFGVLPKRENEPTISIADTTQLQKAGFTCQYNWREGLKKMAEEMKA